MDKAKLEKYRNRLEALRNRTRDDLNRMIDVVREDGRAVGEHEMSAAESIDKEILLEHSEEELHEQVRAALERIEAGTYGQCEECGRKIPDARLNALPFAALCVNCAASLEAES